MVMMLMLLTSLKSLRLPKLLTQSAFSYWAFLGSGSLWVFWVRLCPSRSFWALLGLTWLYWALLGLTGPYWALLDHTNIYKKEMKEIFNDLTSDHTVTGSVDMIF